jgi:hypothetical protein
MESVRKEDILNLSRNLFDSNNLAITLLGPVSGAKQFRNLLAI